MPFDQDDPLAQDGLEEGQEGSAWSGPDEWPSASDERADQAEGRIQDRTGGDSAWESDKNPYKTKYDELHKKYESTPSVARKLQETTSTLQQWAADAWDQNARAYAANPQAPGVFEPRMAQQIIQVKLDELTARAELEATREA